MDVTKIILGLRSELEDIEGAILALERCDRHSTGTTEAAAQLAEIKTGPPLPHEEGTWYQRKR